MAEKMTLRIYLFHYYFKGNRNCAVAAQYLPRQRGILPIELLMVAM